MLRRSGPGSDLPPAVGVVSDELLHVRSDLGQFYGWNVHAPRSYDIATALEGAEILLSNPLEENSNLESYPARVLSRSELMLVAGMNGETEHRTRSGAIRIGREAEANANGVSRTAPKELQSELTLQEGGQNRAQEVPGDGSDGPL